MRYFDLVETPLTGKTFLEGGESRLPATDSRVAVYFQPIDDVKYDRSFDTEGYPILKEYALQEDGTRYQAYLAEPDEDGVYQPDLSALQEALVASNVTTAKDLRDSTIVSDIDVLGSVWQVDDKGRGSMDLAIEYASRNSIPAETTQGWRLADNSVRECTIADLNAVLDAYTERSALIWFKYNEWFLTDKLSEFTVL